MEISYVANGGLKYYFSLLHVTTPPAKSPSCLNFLHVSLTWHNHTCNPRVWQTKPQMF